MDSKAERAVREKVEAFEQAHGRKPRILLLSEDAETYGHSRIVSTLTQRLSDMGGQVVLVSGSHDENIFNFDAEIKRISHFTKTSSGFFTANGLPPLADEAFKAQRHQEVLNIAREIDPDIVVFEFYPLIRYRYRDGDLDAMLKYKKESGKNIPFVTIARDISQLNDSPGGDEAWSKEVKSKLAHFDHLLVCGWKDIRMEDVSPHWSGLDPEPEYLGHVMADEPANDNHALEEKPSVMVFASGEYNDCDRIFFMRAIQAHARSKFAQHPMKVVVAEDCPPKVFEELKREASGSPGGNVTVGKTYDNATFSQDIRNCETAIVRGSYNVTLELAANNKRFVCVPRANARWGGEHEFRAALMERKGICTRVMEAELESENGIEKLTRALDVTTELTPDAGLEYENGKQFAARILQIALKRQPAQEQGAAYAPKQQWVAGR